MPFLRFTVSDPALREQVKIRFFTETARRCVLLHPDHQWYVSAAHTEALVEETLDACRGAFEALRREA